MQESPIYSIDYCVNSVLADLGETSKRHYQKFLNFGIQGYRRLNLGNMVAPTIKTAVLEIDNNTKTAQLPDDYVSYLKVGYSCHGTIINLDYSDELRFGISNDVFPDACQCQDELNQCQQIAGSGQGQDGGFPYLSNYFYYASYFRNGTYVAGFYSYGAGVYRNAYRINTDTWQIQFDSYIKADFILLEYISNGIENGNAFIEETHIPAITAYIHWKAALHDQTKNRLEAQMLERQWKQEVRGVIARQAALGEWDWRNTYRKTLRQTPKR